MYLVPRLLRQAFGTRAEELASSKTLRQLVEISGKNWAQRDVISNLAAMDALLDHKDNITMLEQKSLLIAALQKFDKNSWHGKLSKETSERCRQEWATKEVSNWLGLFTYFVDKLCKAKSSYSQEMRELKTKYFGLDLVAAPASPKVDGPKVDGPKVDGPKVVDLDLCDSLVYPSHSEDELTVEPQASSKAPEKSTSAMSSRSELAVETQASSSPAASSHNEPFSIEDSSDEAIVQEQPVAAERTLVPEFVRTSLSEGTYQGTLEDAEKLLPARRVGVKRKVSQLAKSTLKKPAAANTKPLKCAAMFLGEPVLSNENRLATQGKFKALCSSVIEASTKMPEGTTCLKAIEQLCGAAGLLASDVVMWTVADQIEQPDRLHQKQVGSIAVRHERQVDLYIIQDAKRRQVVMISSKSHGANNVVSAITIIFLCFVAGFTATELHSLKLKMQGIAAQDITPL